MFRFLTDSKNSHFMRLWWAQLISQFGDRLNQMALIGLVAERTHGSAVDLAKLLAFTIFPVFVVGPVAGALVDRWDHRRTLFICDVARGCMVLTIPFIFMYQSSMVPIYIIVFLTFCFSRFYVPAKMSIIPNLVEKEHLLVANSLMTTTGMIAFILGCALGGLIVDHWGARGGFIGDGFTFLFSGLLIFSIKQDLKMREYRNQLFHAGERIIKIEKSLWREVKEGAQYIAAHKEIRVVINILFLLLAAAGAVYVVIIVFIQEAFQSVTKDLGVLAVFLGTGLFLGTLIYGRWGRKALWYKTVFFCLVLGGLMITLFAAAVNHYPNLVLAALLTVVLGMVIGPIFIATNTVVHFVSDKDMRGKVFSALEMVIHFAFLVAMFASSVLAGYVPRVWILVAVGFIFTLVGLAGLLGYRPSRDLVLQAEKMA